MPARHPLIYREEADSLIAVPDLHAACPFRIIEGCFPGIRRGKGGRRVLQRAEPNLAKEGSVSRRDGMDVDHQTHGIIRGQQRNRPTAGRRVGRI